MQPTTHAETQSVRIQVTRDRMSALVVIPPGCSRPSQSALLELAERSRLQLNDVTLARLSAVATGEAVPLAVSGDQASAPTCYVVASGKPPVEPVDGALELDPSLRPRIVADNERADYFSETHFVTVRTGMSVGRIVAPREGQPGVDVYGEVAKPHRSSGEPIRVGPGLDARADGGVEALRDGRLVREGQKIALTEVLEIAGDVDFESGSVESFVDVDVTGGVHPNFHVNCQGAVRIGRVVEAASINAQGDVTIGGGAFGGVHGCTIRSKGTIRAHLFNELKVDADGDVIFDTEAILCSVHANGSIRSEHGAIVGGRAFAREGVSVRVLGTEASTPTTVIVGQDPEVLREARHIDREVQAYRSSAAQIRALVTPLMDNLKRLNAQQREQATELLYKAEEIDFLVSARQAEREEMLASSRPAGAPSILVRGVIYPGTLLALMPRQVKVQELIHGPVRIELRKIANVTEVVAVSQRTGFVRILRSAEVDLDAVAK